MSGPRIDPAPLFDLVTGFPPADAVDVMVPMPLSLALYMTMLESTGHASELAVLRKLNIDQARETARSIRAGIGDLVGPEALAPATLRITQIVEERVPRVNGLRPHVHAFVRAPVDVEVLTVLADSYLLPDYRDRLAAATAERLGLVWDETAGASREIVGPRWLTERTAQLRDDDLSCPGPWPRRQIVAGQQRTRGE